MQMCKAMAHDAITGICMHADNCMLMLQTQCWRLIDYGIAAGIGAALHTAHCTLQYG